MHSARPRLSDLAHAAGVTSATVSMALNGNSRISLATRERVQALAKQMGYRPNGLARGLRKSRSRVIGLLVTDIRVQTFALITLGAESVARERGSSVLLANSENDSAREREYIDLMRDHRVDGLLIVPVGGEVSHLRELANHSVPPVFLHRRPEGIVGHLIRVDEAAGVGLAISHLVSLGRKRIAYAMGTGITAASRARLTGYRTAISESGFDVDERLVVSGSPTYGGGRAAVAELITGGAEFDALVCVGDLVAAGAVVELRQRGIPVPDQVAVCGFEDTDIAQAVDPPLTSVHLRPFEIGQIAARLLLDSIDTHSAELHEIDVAPSLVVRASTAGRGDWRYEGPIKQEALIT